MSKKITYISTDFDGEAFATEDFNIGRIFFIQDRIKVLNNLLDHLGYRERHIIRDSFGLDGDFWSDEMLSLRYGLSKGRIWQIKREAILKMRNKLKRDYMDFIC